VRGGLDILRQLWIGQRDTKLLGDLFASVPHPPDVHELLGANIVSMDDEAAIVLIQQAAKLGVILQGNQPSSVKIQDGNLTEL
jgi:hypothetical protein